MAKVIIEITHPGAHSNEYRIFENLPVTIGRDFQNDIILSDQFVSASHLTVNGWEDGWEVIETGGENGVLVQKHRYLLQSFKVGPGDSIICGQTRIRIFPDDHKPEKTRLLDRIPPLFQKLSRPLPSMIVVFAMSLFIGFNYYMSTHQKKVIDEAIGIVLVILIINLIWAAGWSFVGRTIKHKNSFFTQLSACCLFSLWVFFFTAIGKYFGYLLSSWNFEFVFQVIQGLVAFTLLLYANLSIATNMKRIQKIAFILPVIILIAALVVVARLGEDESSRPEFNSYLFPPGLTLAKEKTISEFIQESTNLHYREK
jgi:type III secretion system (T3SS) inner membrane Yop/YscD-like protein